MPDQDVTQDTWRIVLNLKEDESLDILLTASEFANMVLRVFSLPPV